MACQEASILSRQNASIMSRQIRIGTLASRNRRDGSRGAGASAGGVQFVAIWICRVPYWYGKATPLLRKSAALGRKVRIRCGGQQVRSGRRGRVQPVQSRPARQADFAVLPPSSPAVGGGTSVSVCRARCWRSGLLPCVRSNFPEQSGLFFRSNSGRNGTAGRL